MEKKKSLFWVVICVLFLVTTYSCGESSDNKKEREKASLLSQQQEAIKKGVISKYENALIFPSKDFLLKRVFTYTLQKLLLSNEGRPVIFNGYLEDISKKGKQFFIHFSFALDISKILLEEKSSFPSLLLSGFVGKTIRFHLKCDYEDVKPLLDATYSTPSDASGFAAIMAGVTKTSDFLVVCKVSDVTKIVNYTVQGYPVSEEEVELEIETPDFFSVNGELIEMVKTQKSF
jgi:hypothetical protein